MSLTLLRHCKPVKDVNRNIRRVTVLRQLGGVGDVLMLSPIFRGLKERYGSSCKVTVATSWAYYAGALPMIFRHNPFIDEIVRVEPHEFAPPSLKYSRWDFKGVPNDNPPQCVIDTDLVIDLNCICSHTETIQQPNVTMHRTDIWCQAAGVNPSCKKPILVLTPEEIAWGREWCNENLGQGIRIGLQLKAHDWTRSWPYAESFAHRLRKEGYKVCTFDATQRIGDIPSPMGQPIRKVAAVAQHLHVMVAPDSGMLHVAGAMGTPILGLFGSTDPEMRMREYAGSYTDPRKLVPCGPCWYLKPCLKSNDRRDWISCMQRISEDLVLDELEKLLTRYNHCPPNYGSLIPMAQLSSPR